MHAKRRFNRQIMASLGSRLNHGQLVLLRYEWGIGLRLIRLHDNKCGLDGTRQLTTSTEEISPRLIVKEYRIQYKRINEGSPFSKCLHILIIEVKDVSWVGALLIGNCILLKSLRDSESAGKNAMLKAEKPRTEYNVPPIKDVVGCPLENLEYGSFSSIT